MSNLPPPLPTLPQPLIDAIAEYGFARTDGAHEAERIHRWSRLIAEIKIYARSYAEEAVRLEREAYRELWTAAARVALSNGFDAAYPNNLAALKSMIQSTRGRARSQEGQG